MNPLEPVKKKKNDEEEGANLMRRLEDLPLMSVEYDESPGACEEEDLEVRMMKRKEPTLCDGLKTSL